MTVGKQSIVSVNSLKTYNNTKRAPFINKKEALIFY